MNLIKSYPYHSPDVEHSTRRFTIVQRADGNYSIADEYYYRSTDKNGLIYDEGWATLSPNGIFASTAIAEQEIRRLIGLENWNNF